MEEQHTLDSIVREAVQQAKLGEFSRKTSYEREEDDISEHLRMHFGRVNGKIIYEMVDTVTVIGYCHKVHGIRKRSDPLHMITPESVERYEAAKRKQRKKEDEKYKREYARWEKSVANLAHNHPFRNLNMPLNAHTVGVDGQVDGVLVDSYKDKNWLTARLDKIVIQYVHPDAIMNIERFRKTTDLTGEALLSAMEQVRARYNGEIGYLNGIELHDWHYQQGLRGGTPTDGGLKPKEQQNNVFQKEFKGTTTVDEITDAIKNVYATGEAFRAGIYRLQEEKAARVAEEARIRGAATEAMVSKF